MTSEFREAELIGWSQRSTSYDQYLAPITNQVIGPVLEGLGSVAGRRVLDICCGPGHLAAALSGERALAVGLDFSGPMVDRARLNYPGIDFLQGDAEALPFDDGTFDHAVCAFGVMHLSRADVAIAEAFRILHPGGRYAFTQWAKDDEVLGIVFSAIAEHGAPVSGLPDAPPPQRFSDPTECRRVLQSVGFRDVRVERIETAWTTTRPEDLLDLVYGGAVRAALVLEAQSPDRRERIHRAITDAAAARDLRGVVTIRRPAVLAWGTKPTA